MSLFPQWHSPDDEDLPEPPQIRRLRRLVSALIVVLIAGVLIVTGTLVIRLVDRSAARVSQDGDPKVALRDALSRPAIAADAFNLPEGNRVIALGRAAEEVLIVTRDAAGREWLHSFDAETGAVRSISRIERRAAPENAPASRATGHR